MNEKIEDLDSGDEGQMEEHKQGDVDENISVSESEDENFDDDDDGESEEGSGDEEEGSGDEEEGSGDEEESQDVLSGSSSSDEETERCPICLAKFRDQYVGFPEGCDHSFCLECIVEWSKNVNTCPVDRQVFHIILARESFDGVVLRKINVEDQTLQLEEAAFDDTTHCELCGNTDSEDRMLLCDSCDLGYHMACLTPPLENVPRGMWFCPTCLPNLGLNNHQTEEVAEEISSDEEVIHPPRSRQYRALDDDGIQIGRTLVRERVLRAITRIRGSTQVIESESESEIEAENTEASTSSATRKSQTPRRKRRTVRRKKTWKRKRKSSAKSKKSSTVNAKSGKKRRFRRRKKLKKGSKSARTKRLTPKTVKKRIADHLGLKSPPVGRTIPIVKGKQDKNAFLHRGDSGPALLNIMGDRNEIIHFSDESDEDMTGEQDGVLLARRATSRSDISSSRIQRIKSGLATSRRSRPVTVPSPPPTMSCDLLGSIMDGQNMLMTEHERILIKRDGSLAMKHGFNNNNRVYGRGDNNVNNTSPQDGDTGAQDGGSDGQSSPNSPPNDQAAEEPTQSDDTHEDHVEANAQDNVISGANDNPDDGFNNDEIPTLSPKETSKSDDEENRDRTDNNSIDENDKHESKQLQRHDSENKRTINSSSDSKPNNEQNISSGVDRGSCDGDKKPILSLTVNDSKAIDSPLRSYLYSPEDPTSPSSDSVHIAMPAVDDASQSEIMEVNEMPVETGDSTPLFDEESQDNKSEDEAPRVECRAKDNIHIVPFSELPRIPKIKKKTPEVIQQELETESSNNSHASVLERLQHSDKQESYPKWDKAKRDRKHLSDESYDRDSKDDERRRNRDEESGDRSRRDRRHSRSRSRERSRDKRSKDHDRGHERSRRSRSGERSRKRSRSKSREQTSDSDRRRRDLSRDRFPRSRSRSPPRRQDNRDKSNRDDGNFAGSRPPFRLKRNFDGFNRESEGPRMQQQKPDPPWLQERQRMNDSNPRKSEGNGPGMLMDPRNARVPELMGHTDKRQHNVIGNDVNRGLPSSQENLQPNRKSPINLLELRLDGPPVPTKNSGLFKVPETPPPRHSMSHMPDEYDPSQPTDSGPSPPQQLLEMFDINSLAAQGRQSPMQPRMQFADLLRAPHRGPLLADPPREQHPGHFVRLPDNLAQVLPTMPGFNMIQHNLHAQNVRPPLLLNPPMIGGGHLGRLPRLAGHPHISWQAVSHPNVIIHNRIPIQVSQNGMPLHPSETFLHPPPRMEPPQSMIDNLSTPPPPLPPKALEEMQQISQLLNAQAHLAHMATKNEQMVQYREPMRSQDNGPPMSMRMTVSDGKFVTFEEKMEVIDMDVASPSSDELANSSTPPGPHDDDGHVELNLHRTHIDHIASLKAKQGEKNARKMDKKTNRSDDISHTVSSGNKDEKFLKKLNHQERVVEEVKLAIKPHYSKGRLNKEQYKEILRKAVPKICHSKSGDINPEKIRKYVEQYVEKVRHSKNKPR